MHHLLPTATPSPLPRTLPSIPLVQIGIELHMAPNYFKSERTSIHMSVLFLHMANLGYAPYSRDDNFHGDCCSEYSFLRVEM